jgi:hypothetical protein
VEELVRTLEKKDHEIRMLQDIVRQLQRGGKPVSHLQSIAHEWFTPCSNDAYSFDISSMCSILYYR